MPPTHERRASARTRRFALLALLASVGRIPESAAHERWLEIEPFRVPSPDTTTPRKVYLLTGEALHKAELLPERRRARFSRFELLLSGPRRDLRPLLREDQQPLAVLPGAQLPAGTTVLALDSEPSIIELPAEKFSAYLLEERLIDILALRVAQRQEDAVGRERYSRCIKALLHNGPGPSDAVTRPVGQALEIIPARDPYTLRPGEELPVQVLLRGEPLAGRAMILASRRRGEVRARYQRTDSAGRLRVLIDRGGDWLLALVHMEPAREADVDWRSTWTSLTFSLPD